MKLSELLKLGKETQDVPQSIFDSEKTQSKFAELTEFGKAAAGLHDDIESIKGNPLGFSLGVAAGGLIESVREYAGQGIEFDLYDVNGNRIFADPVPPPNEPAE